MIRLLLRREIRGISDRLGLGLLVEIIKVLTEPTDIILINWSLCSYHVYCLLPLIIGLLRSKVLLIILLLIRLHHSVRILLLSRMILILIKARLVSLLRLGLHVVHNSVPTVHCGRLFFRLSSRS